MIKRCCGKFHYCIALMVLFFSNNCVFSQSSIYNTNWKFLNPSQFAYNLTDLDFYDNNNVLAVGSDGGIAKSADGGNNWTYGTFSFLKNGSFERAFFNDVHYVSANVAYAVGSRGCMAKTNDGGVSWTFVNTPLFSNTKSINTVWFTSENTGYIAGQWNTLDSIPKVYFTNNGGTSWDSLATPAVNGTTKVGFINNPTYPPIDLPITGKGKEIYRIIFLNNSIGYISGGTFASAPLNFPNIPFTSNCAYQGTQTTSTPTLLWKFDNGTLTDYSVSKERLGYSGVPLTLNCTSKYLSVPQASNIYKAFNIIDDTTVVLLAFNNNVVLKVHTGKNDSVENFHKPGVFEKGRYEVLNTGPSGPPPGYPQIPAVQVLAASNPTQLHRAANGKLFAAAGQGALWTSVDTGRTWVRERSLPPGMSYSGSNTPASDISPGGKLLTGGVLGVVADSIAGSWHTNYKLQVNGGYDNVDFADCNNGIATGGTGIAVTNDGGKTWFDRTRLDFPLGTQIRSSAYVPGDPSKAYFVTSLGTIYKSIDMNVVPPAVPAMDPVYADNTLQLWDVATIGNDSVWVCGHPRVTTTSSRPIILRSTNGGNTWTTYNNFFPGMNIQNFRLIRFADNMVGYVAGSKDTIWKTTDGGLTWNRLPLPTPAVNPQITYYDMCVVDANTVYLTGSGFPRSVVFKSTDGGNTWQDVASNILSTYPNFTLNTTSGAIVFHDANKGYITAGAGLFITTDGGATWTLDLGPNGMAGALAFAPKKVTVPVAFENRKLIVTGQGVLGSGGLIAEYGRPANINVNATETVVNVNCTNPTAGSITLNATGGIAPYTYSIDGGTFQTSNSFTGLAQGAKTITIKDAYCGVLSKTVNVGFTDNLALNANNDTIVCVGASVPMLASTNGTGTTYAWTPTAGLSNPNVSNPVATVSANTVYTVTATLNGCVKSETVNIGTKANPVISAGTDKTIVAGDQAQLQGSANNVVSVAWTPANTLTNANTLLPMAKPSATTTYTLTVKNTENCTSTDDVKITVLPYCVDPLNAFTPNGDGTNDRWIVTKGTCASQVKVRVFNRYGQEVYINENYQNDWNGTFNNKPVPDGTYYYAIDFKLINGKAFTVKGDVTILR